MSVKTYYRHITVIFSDISYQLVKLPGTQIFVQWNYIVLSEKAWSSAGILLEFFPMHPFERVLLGVKIIVLKFIWDLHLSNLTNI